MTRGIVTPSPMIGTSNQIRGVSEVFYKYDDHWLVETKLCTYGEDGINLVKYPSQAVYLSLTEVLSVNERFDWVATRAVKQALTVGQWEGGFDVVGVPHPQLDRTSLNLTNLTDIDKRFINN